MDNFMGTSGIENYGDIILMDIIFRVMCLRETLVQAINIWRTLSSEYAGCENKLLDDY